MDADNLVEHDYEIDGVRVWELTGRDTVTVDATSSLLPPRAWLNGREISGPGAPDRLRDAARRLNAAADYFERASGGVPR